jgi:hypothetical protein
MININKCILCWGPKSTEKKILTNQKINVVESVGEELFLPEKAEEILLPRVVIAVGKKGV